MVCLDKSEQSDLVSKFQGDGLTFKAKLYGTVDVKGARGKCLFVHIRKGQ